MPFDILGTIILSKHFYFLWQLPSDNDDYAKKIGRIKALFTKSFKDKNKIDQVISESRKKYRESHIWQRRFWEHINS